MTPFVAAGAILAPGSSAELQEQAPGAELLGAAFLAGEGLMSGARHHCKPGGDRGSSAPSKGLPAALSTQRLTCRLPATTRTLQL